MKYQIVADESVDFRIVTQLRQIGLTVYAFAEQRPSIKDEEVLAIANENDALITEDKDFGELVFRLQLPHRGVLLIRIADVQEKIASVVRTIQSIMRSCLISSRSLMAISLELRSRRNPTYMLRQIFLGLSFALFLTSCDSHSATKADKDSPAEDPADSGQQKITYNPRVLAIAPALLHKYQEACQHDTVAYDKKFVSNFFNLIKKFNGKKLDTTILTIGNLDGDLDQDTIFSRVYYDADTIYVESKWIKNNHVLWKDKYTDPYTSLDANLYESTRNTWVCFAVGIIYGPPDISPRNEVDSGALTMVYNQGVDDLIRAGVNTDKKQYKAYLQNFKGELLAYGQPESRERLWIWYKPAGRMITYYQP